MDGSQVIFPFALTAAQMACMQRAIAHELVRTSARARDERLGDDTRANELAIHREMRALQDRMRRLDPA